MAHDAFISYSSKDKPVADAACAILEANGIRCWIAPRDILPGREWGAEIVEAVRASRVMVLVFSTHANTSPQIEREVERAVHAGVPILPFRIDEVMPSGSMEYFLSTPHWMDAMTPPLEGHLVRLTATLRTLLGLPANTESPAEPSPEEPRVTPQEGVPGSPIRPVTAPPSAAASLPLPAVAPSVARSPGSGGLLRVLVGAIIALLVIGGGIFYIHSRSGDPARTSDGMRGGSSGTAPPIGGTAVGGNSDALFTAAGHGDAVMVKQLLEGGAPVDARNAEGQTPLMVAAQIGFEDVVKTLLDRGADVKIKDHDGNTAWNYAAQGGNADTLRALLNKGADMKSVNSDGYTAWDYLALHGATDALNVLLDAGADVNARNKDGKTALMEAARIGFAQTVHILLQRGADVKIKDRDGITAWNYAAQSGNAELQGDLLEKGADMKSVDRDGVDAWFYAAAHGSADSLKLLLEHGYPINARDKDGATALQIASKIGFTDSVKALLRQGANVNAKDKDGNTALSLAVHSYNAALVALLKAAGAQ